MLCEGKHDFNNANVLKSTTSENNILLLYTTATAHLPHNAQAISRPSFCAFGSPLANYRKHNTRCETQERWQRALLTLWKVKTVCLCGVWGGGGSTPQTETELGVGGGSVSRVGTGQGCPQRDTKRSLEARAAQEYGSNYWHRGPSDTHRQQRVLQECSSTREG